MKKMSLIIIACLGLFACKKTALSAEGLKGEIRNDAAYKNLLTAAVNQLSVIRHIDEKDLKVAATNKKAPDLFKKSKTDNGFSFTMARNEVMYYFFQVKKSYIDSKLITTQDFMTMYRTDLVKKIKDDLLQHRLNGSTQSKN